ncbi:unnamed protein product, partial [Phaeothamnion confervicola]
SGFLHKWRERDAFMWGGSTWEKLFFTVRGSTLSVFATEHDPKPRSVISIAGCVLRDEGVKPGRRRGAD